MFEKMLDGIEVRLNTDFFENKEEYLAIADTVLFTGMIGQIMALFWRAGV